MRAYTTQIIYSIKCNGRFTNQYDEQWRLVFADNETQAIEQSKEIGKQEECNIVDRNGRIISWDMIAIKEVKEVELNNGSLLNSHVVDVAPIPEPVWEH